MLEPVVRPSTGKFLLGLGVVLCVALALWNETVTTRSGAVGLALLMPGFAVALLVRLAGVFAGEREGGAAMPWGYRVASWVVAGGNAWIFGILQSVPAALVYGGLVVADAAAGMAAPKGEARRRTRKLPTFALALAGAIAILVALHLLVAPRIAWWPLFDWGAAVVLATLGLRVGLAAAGPAKDEDVRPPPSHRVHARTPRPLDDPQREGAERAVRLFKERGDVQALVQYAEEVARLARLADRAREELRQRVPAAAARPRTSREEDLEAAVAVIERALEERANPLPVKPRPGEVR